MISKTIVCGWLAFPIQLKETASGDKYVRNVLNVPRNYKDQQGKTIYDSINFIAYKTNAEYLAKYCKKGDFLILSGRLQTSSYVLQEAVEENGVLVAKEKKINKMELYVEETTIRNGTGVQAVDEEKLQETKVEESIYDVYNRLKPTAEEEPDLYIPED